MLVRLCIAFVDKLRGDEGLVVVRLDVGAVKGVACTDGESSGVVGKRVVRVRGTRCWYSGNKVQGIRIAFGWKEVGNDTLTKKHSQEDVMFLQFCIGEVDRIVDLAFLVRRVAGVKIEDINNAVGVVFCVLHVVKRAGHAMAREVLPASPPAWSSLSVPWEAWPSTAECVVAASAKFIVRRLSRKGKDI